jgi:hypothetical protein
LVSYQFLEGYAVGTAQMLCVDAVILVIVWPLRKFIALLKEPGVRLKIETLLGMHDDGV